MLPRLAIAIGIAVVPLLLSEFFRKWKSRREPDLKRVEGSSLLKLISKEEVTSRIRKLRFALSSPTDTLSLAVGQHIRLTAMIEGEKVTRSYTPTSSSDEGFLELTVKILYSDERLTFSKFLDEMRIGEQIAFEGPCGNMQYLGDGCFAFFCPAGHPPKLKTKKMMNMFAVDGGICSMMQIMKSVLENPSDVTKINLVYLSDSDKHIMLKDELDELALKHPEQLNISYVGEESSLATVFNPSDQVITLACPPMQLDHGKR